MANPQNIVPHQWKPGQSGNPKGKPKGQTLTEVLRRKLFEEVELTINGKKVKRPRVDHMCEAAFVHATKGNAAYFKEIFERLDGKVAQALEHSGPEGEPIKVRYVCEGTEKPKP